MGLFKMYFKLVNIKFDNTYFGQIIFGLQIGLDYIYKLLLT
jgi:hypothetical protein